jgi:hypothetical protein
LSLKSDGSGAGEQNPVAAKNLTAGKKCGRTNHESTKYNCRKR